MGNNPMCTYEYLIGDGSQDGVVDPGNGRIRYSEKEWRYLTDGMDAAIAGLLNRAPKAAAASDLRLLVLFEYGRHVFAAFIFDDVPLAFAQGALAGIETV